MLIQFFFSLQVQIWTQHYCASTWITMLKVRSWIYQIFWTTLNQKNLSIIFKNNVYNCYYVCAMYTTHVNTYDCIQCWFVDLYFFFSLDANYSIQFAIMISISSMLLLCVSKVVSFREITATNNDKYQKNGKRINIENQFIFLFRIDFQTRRCWNLEKESYSNQLRTISIQRKSSLCIYKIERDFFCMCCWCCCFIWTFVSRAIWKGNISSEHTVMQSACILSSTMRAATKTL